MSEKTRTDFNRWRWPHLVHERQSLAAMDAYFDHIGYKTHPRPITI